MELAKGAGLGQLAIGVREAPRSRRRSPARFSAGAKRRVRNRPGPRRPPACMLLAPSASTLGQHVPGEPERRLLLALVERVLRLRGPRALPGPSAATTGRRRAAARPPPARDIIVRKRLAVRPMRPHLVRTGSSPGAPSPPTSATPAPPRGCHRRAPAPGAARFASTKAATSPRNGLEVGAAGLRRACAPPGPSPGCGWCPRRCEKIFASRAYCSTGWSLR